MAPSIGLHQLSLAILTAGWISVGPIAIVAQTSTAVCLSSFDWMSNSRGQNPCVVSAYLQGTCNDGQFSISPLPTGHYYSGPNANKSTPCKCSSVTYNTISACGLCQNRTIISWSVWDTNCTTIYPGVFPLDIPAGTAVPHWAFQDVTTSDLFNVTLAKAVGDSPESTALNNAKSTGSVILVSTVAPALLTASPSPTETCTASLGSSSNAAAIVGGVVGGVVGLALIAAIVLLVMKKRSQAPPWAQPTASPMSPLKIAQPKHYNPSDTSPTSSSPSTIRTGSSPPSMQPGYYTGMLVVRG